MKKYTIALLLLVACIAVLGFRGKREADEFSGQITFLTYIAEDGSYRTIAAVNENSKHALLNAATKNNYGEKAKLYLQVGTRWCKVVLTYPNGKGFENYISSDLIIEFQAKHLD